MKNNNKKIHHTFFIEGRKWLDKINGNTYHSVQISVDGKIVRTIGLTYGYGSAWEQTACAALKEMGYIPDTDAHCFYISQFSDYVGKKYVYSTVSNVLKRDLFKGDRHY